ncbi:MAG: hypothetical protein KF691_00880 [Phycisphaeraceae bacterium]|nr:hypothetical protein [Phycisphaeraceae bacterium]
MTTTMTKPKAHHNAMVEEHLRASKKVMKKVLKSKKRSIRFLVAAGILTKSGKSLAKPYR